LSGLVYDSITARTIRSISNRLLGFGSLACYTEIRLNTKVIRGSF
jgi:hypothetical protein